MKKPAAVPAFIQKEEF